MNITSLSDKTINKLCDSTITDCKSGHSTVLHCSVLHCCSKENKKKKEDLYLLIGSMVSSLDTKSLPAELIFFHTDLTAHAQ